MANKIGTAARPRILIADDEVVQRYTLKLIIRDHGEIVGEAMDGQAAVELAVQLRPDVVLLDVSMPVMGGIEAASRILKSLPETRIIIVSNHSSRAYVEEAFNRGAQAYVFKASAMADLPQAITEVLNGRTFRPESHVPVEQNRDHPSTAADRGESQNVAEDAELRLALAYARSVIDTVREPLLVLDETLHVKFASRAFFNTFEVTASETEGRFVYELGNGQWDIPALRSLLGEVLSKDREFRDYDVSHDFPHLGRRVMLLNARKLWTETAATNLILLAIEDITERKRILDDLVRSNEDLQRFVYVAAHDLRAPLNSALNLCQLLARRIDPKLDIEEREMLRMSTDSMERLGILMNDLLAYSEVGNVPQRGALVSLHEPLSIALANLQHHIEASEAKIRSGELPTLKTDRTQMAMLFQNLISNAIKYRRNDRPLWISIEAVQINAHCQVSVADNGQGFAVEHSIYIFEPFKRLHGKEIKGSGIGLATCKRIVERWGGRIWAESVPGEGATFFFTVQNIVEAPGSISPA